MKRFLVLTGFMGSGKSSVAKRVAAKLGWQAVDTDKLIERNAGVTIAEIFETFGEPYFRKIETDTLRECLKRDRTVLSVGGGLLVSEENRRMLEGVPVVNLAASFDTIYERISHTGHVRPLVRQGRQRLYELYEARRPLYEAIELQVSTDGKASSEVAEEVLKVVSSREGFDA